MGDIACYRPDEILNELNQGQGLGLSIADEGLALYDNGIFNEMQKQLEKLKDIGLKRTNYGWYYPPKDQ